MEISKTSWHYRLYRYASNITKGPIYLIPWKGERRTEPNLPSSLCPYAWSVFLSVVGALVILLFASALAIPGAILYVIGMAIVYTVHSLNHTARSLGGLLPERKPREKKDKPPKPKKADQKSILIEYIKAQKAKVCPTIRLVD